MKNKVLCSLFLAFLVSLTSYGQSIPNYSFEAWVTDTNYLNLTVTTPPTLDTAVSSNPQYWTTSNQVTNGSFFGHKILVTQSATSYVGNSAIQLESDSLSASIVGLPTPFPNPYPLNFVCPGFAVCGTFPINLASFISLGSSFNPALLPGAGIPITGRVDKIGGYMKYKSVGGDSAYIVAILRKGSSIVATATYTRSTTDNGYSYFEVPFVYQSCENPDTLVYTISSGDPYSISGVALGNPSGLHKGSTVLVDSIFYTGSPVYGIAYPKNDSTSTHISTPVTIDVTTNDSSCSQRIFTISQSVAPRHGSITISGDSVTYTPTTGFAGLDTFTYAEAVGTGPSATAQVIVLVSGHALGINDITEGKTSIYPNPASTKLHIINTNTAVTELRVFDMLGNVLKDEPLSASDNTIDVSGFNNGLYIIQFSSAGGKMITSSRFTVIK